MSGGGEEIVFHIEVLRAFGLPKAERTVVQLVGFGLDGPITSLPAEESSVEPEGWLFPSIEAIKAEQEKQAAAAAPPDPKAKGKNAPPPPVDDKPPPPEPAAVFRFPRPCGTPEQRQRLLDDICGVPLRVVVLRATDGGEMQPLGTATLETDLQELIHQTGGVQVVTPLRWAPELLDQMKAEAEAEAAAAAEAAARPDAEDGAAGEAGDGSGAGPEDAEPANEFSWQPPADGVIHVNVRSAGPIGRILCPEDLDDWNVLTVQIDGLFNVPQTLVNADGDAPKEVVGVYEPHPFNYSLRVLGLELNGGQLMLPAAPPEDVADEAADGGGGDDAGNAVGDTSAGGAGDVGDGGLDNVPGRRMSSGSIAVGGVGAAMFVAGVGREEFVEGFVRAGFVTAHQDAPMLFDFLDRTRSGSVGPEEFARLNELGAPPAESKHLLKLRAHLHDRFGGGGGDAAADTDGQAVDANAFLDQAFDALDADAEGSLDLEGFRTALDSIVSFAAAPEEVDAIFSALSSSMGTVTRDDLRSLALHKRMADLQATEKAAQWLLACCGSLQALTQQVDDTKSGVITSSSWTQAMQRLGFPNIPEDQRYPQAPLGTPAAELVYDVLARSEESIPNEALNLLEKLNTSMLTKAMPKFHQLLENACEGAFDPEKAFAALGGSASPGVLNVTDFEAGCRRIGFSATDPAAIFALLDTTGAGRVGVDELASVASYVAARRQGRLLSCKAFIKSTFGDVDSAFRKLFDDNTELYKDAEETKPRVEWPESSLSGYRGRAWLQQLLNTLGDDRGRNLANEGEGRHGGAWVYLFPVLKGQAAPLDYRDAEPAQAELAKVARQHHGQAFLDLRRLSAPVGTGSGGGPDVEFRIFLSQVEDMGDLQHTASFGHARTFIKGTIKLDRPLVRLCPRDIRPLPQSNALGSRRSSMADEEVSLIPPPPEKKPPPTTSEDLVTEASLIVGRLAVEFARMCKERALEEPQIGAAAMEELPPLLGRMAEPGSFCAWLVDTDGPAGTSWRELAADLRPAIVRLVRAEARDGPPCGLSGNEKDAMYSGIRDVLLAHLYRALNRDVDADNRRRDSRLWRSPVQATGVGAARASSTGGNGKGGGETDESLRRLIFEYEMCGDYERAADLFKERLALPQNEQNSEVWYGYARYLVRSAMPSLEQQDPNSPCSQLLDAEQALRFAASVRPPAEGPHLPETAMLACILQDRRMPSSLDSVPSQDADRRFEAAMSLLMGYIDKHSSDSMAYLIAFALLAAEAHELRDEAAVLESMDPTKGVSSAAARRAEEAAVRREQLKAQALKYLELARVPPVSFARTLGGHPGRGDKPGFSDFEHLLQRERISRGEVIAPPGLSQKPATPEAWATQVKGIFETYESVHKMPNEDDAMALDVVDALLHFGAASLVEFLITECHTEASEGYNFLTATSAASERCLLQRIRAAMLQGSWTRAQELIKGDLFGVTDRIPEAYALLGECNFRAVRDSQPDGGRSPAVAYSDAVDAFRKALDFYPDSAPSAKGEDPLIHLRLASIYFMHAEESGFSDEAALSAAMEHLKQSLLIGPTAEAWRCAGVCSYQEACLRRARIRAAAAGGGDAAAGGSAASTAAGPAALAPEALFAEAVRFLAEANQLDRRSPQINVWLATCAVETGRVQIAKQTIRQVLRFGERLDVNASIHLASLLLRFSDESKALPGQRPRLVQVGRYAHEVIAMARLALRKTENGQARYLLARAHAMLNEDAATLAEIRVAIPLLLRNPPEQQDEATEAARSCATQLVSHWAAAGAAKEKNTRRLATFEGAEEAVAFNGVSPLDVLDEDLPLGLKPEHLLSDRGRDVLLAAVRPQLPA